jgi:hypothetical protein
MLCAVNPAGREVNHSGGELERRPETLPVPYAEGEHRGEFADVVDWAALASWVRTRDRGVLLAGLALIAGELIWKSLFLGHFYFRQDDFHVLELALAHPFSWSYLTFVGAGHLIPGVYAIAWGVSRISPYSWALAGTIAVLMLAAAGLLALRLLRTLFGSRPAILVPLAIYLLTPMTMPDLGWWTSAIESLPLQIAIFGAVNAQVYYVRTGRFRHAVAAAAWLLFGLFFFEKALVLPLLLLGVSSGFLTDGPWPRAIRRSLVEYWRGWALQLAIVGGYLVVLLTSLQTSAAQPGIPGSNAGVFTFIGEIIKDTFAPGALGGPWQWFPSGDSEYAYSAPPGALAWLSVVVVVVVILASIAYRKYAWRAWAILAGWLLGADIIPVLIGRISELGPNLIGLETRYVADAAPALAICLGLAFWPVTGRPDTVRGRRAAPNAAHPGRMVAAGVLGAFIIGSVWSVQDYQNVTTSTPDRTFIANARVAVAQAPSGTVIFDEPVPSSLMLGIFGKYAYASQLVKPLESTSAAASLRWTSRPDGTIDRLLVFGADGRLRQAKVYGEGVLPGTQGQNCLARRPKPGPVVLRFSQPTPASSRLLHVGYLASSKVSGDYTVVSYGLSSYTVTVRTGLHDAYFPVTGSADSVTLSGPAVRGLCVGDAEAGVVLPSSSGLVIPAKY